MEMLPLELVGKDIARKNLGYARDFLQEQIIIEKKLVAKQDREWNSSDVARMNEFEKLLKVVFAKAKAENKPQPVPNSQQLYRGMNPSTQQSEMRKRSIWIKPDGMVELEERKIPMEVKFTKIS